MKHALIFSMFLAVTGACHHEPPPQEPPPQQIEGGDKQPAADESGQMVSPDKMEEVSHDLARKGESVSRCLAIAIDNKELPRNSKGKKTVEVVIENQHATSVKVVKESLESKSLDDCVIMKVKEIEFPQMPKPYETSYTYQFEAI
jgi:hypothetical protein